jgi:predicted Zn-dependent protease
MTTLRFVPEVADFDPLRALAQVRGMADWAGIRYHCETSQQRAARDGKPDANRIEQTRGAMLEAMVDGQIAYAGTSDLSPAGIARAMGCAVSAARAAGRKKLFGFGVAQRPKTSGRYASPHRLGTDRASLGELSDLLLEATRRLKVSERIVSTEAVATIGEVESRYVSSNGSEIAQQFLYITSNFAATARDGSESQRRTMNGEVARCRQIGLEVFDREVLFAGCERVGREATELLDAPDCPSGARDLILQPDQMCMQIHESIGHPLELDRILGDERNYAGWSFVRPEDFGTLQYGSRLMNVTFDPGVAHELASYAFDDCGNPATREYLIKDGVLLRGLGGLESQARLGQPGVANFRAASWNRAPIDRMANINLEPGDRSLAEMIAMTGRGIVMHANRSWSIDDYRNKFQFGCEYGQLIEDGRVTRVVKNPNYRGVTTPFWNLLKAVGRREEFELFGLPYCGKGEPSQVIRVGHASPPCLFSGVEVFGGGK